MGKITKELIIEKGEEILLYDRMNAWLYRPDSNNDEAWLYVEDGEIIEPVSWHQTWHNTKIGFRPDLKYAAILGIDSLDKLVSQQLDDDWIICPFCNSHYVNRFEIRLAKQECYLCQGIAERAMQGEALFDAWLEQIRANRDIEMGERLMDLLADGCYKFELHRTLRLLKSESKGEG
ncbi:hypothetical protein FD723_40110 (plasmid) [Nostoc sp. C052]|uniref:hypothetical protein n=1 Tax=Nostoc sp. C052 TaxID=2576902 RepID=UPI0015C3EE3B|nr:hypothetical protein [Nostoc sp. C052]QLE46418.1 hypothetical protein FD723_40110 [Nostoc sp. C052]